MPRLEFPVHVLRLWQDKTGMQKPQSRMREALTELALYIEEGDSDLPTVIEDPKEDRIAHFAEELNLRRGDTELFAAYVAAEFNGNVERAYADLRTANKPGAVLGAWSKTR